VDQDVLELHKLYRQRIVDEDAVLNNRMLWLIYSQTLLFTLWGVLFAYAKPFPPAGRIVVMLFGIGFAALSLVSILGAQKEIDSLEKAYLRLLPGAKSNRVDALTEVGLAGAVHRLRRMFGRRGRHRKADESSPYPLPALTGEEIWHDLGHLTPTVTPILALVLWILLTLVTWSLNPADAADPATVRGHAEAAGSQPPAQHPAAPAPRKPGSD
jgi:hypothetical protein